MAVSFILHPLMGDDLTLSTAVYPTLLRSFVRLPSTGLWLILIFFSSRYGLYRLFLVQ